MKHILIKQKKATVLCMIVPDRLTSIIKKLGVSVNELGLDQLFKIPLTIYGFIVIQL